MNIVQAYAAGVMALNTPRGDEKAAHVSDYGKCRYSVYARIAGLPAVPRSMKTAARLQKGLHDEDFIVDRILAGLDPDEGWQAVRNVRVEKGAIGHLDLLLKRRRDSSGDWAHYDGVNWFENRLSKYGNSTRLIGPSEIERCYIEIKTTEWKESWEEVPGEFTPTGKQKKRKVYAPYEGPARWDQILQATGYCEQLPKNPDGSYVPATLLQFDRRSNQVIQYPGAGKWFHTEDYLNDLAEEKAAIIDMTRPDFDPIATGIAFKNADGLIVGDPPAPFWCGYCDNALCAKNINPDGLAIPA